MQAPKTSRPQVTFADLDPAQLGPPTSSGRPSGALLRALSDNPSGLEQGTPLRPRRRCRSPYPRSLSSCDLDFQETGRAGSPLSPAFGRPEMTLPSLPITNRNVKPDAGDESLQRYKESLGLGGGADLSDPNDPRVCIIQSLSMEAEGRDPIVIDLSVEGSEKELVNNPFTIKEGAKFTMTANFKVQHEILSGLHYVQTVKRKGIRLSKTSEMIGSYPPNTEKNPIYTKKFAEEEAPSGMLMNAHRGTYHATSSFVDDDKKTHLQFEWDFKIAKDW
ncbi:immunoglobulin E-set [Lasiosphaeria ovina]|uniref:Immunoglobulin E-set n=1 Tax=Lasiosphaeria ovina TaxID=92902 RepID=A0AAE0KLI1_9PEZI|nr:immunoglobulin E-set [Lasiosphaeria ovina]